MTAPGPRRIRVDLADAAERAGVAGRDVASVRFIVRAGGVEVGRVTLARDDGGPLRLGRRPPLRVVITRAPATA